METQKNKSDNSVRTLISNGIETLFARNGKPNAESDNTNEADHDGQDIYDVVIVGSGYGGSIAAEKLAGRTVNIDEKPARKIKVCVIERGKEFLPGTFPSRLEEAPTEVRFSDPSKSDTKGNREGLYDFRPGKDVNVVLANGVGGGSLINAGVMMRAKDQVFESWPKKFNKDGKLNDYYDIVTKKLVATTITGTHVDIINRISSTNSTAGKVLHKSENLKRLDTKACQETDLSIAMRDSQNYAGVSLKACKLCGDCSSGCNFQSKNSLDANILYKAWSHGVEVFTGGSVLTIEKDGDGWIVNVVYTHEDLRKQNPKSVPVRCKNVILSAGSLGTTEILLRSENDELRFSNLLGSQFSTNGDMIITAYNQEERSNSVADEKVRHSKRHIGPTITAMIDKRVPHSTKGFVVQDMAIPAICHIFFTEFLSTLASLKRLTQIDSPWRSRSDDAHNDPSSVNPRAIDRTSVYAAMGDDGAKGKLYLPNSKKNQHEGSIKISWKAIRKSELFDEQIRFLRSALSKKTLFGKTVNGELFPNPFWKLLPDRMQRAFLNDLRGPVATVHPLGGCPMGDSVESGVTNHVGKVFDIQSHKKRFHKGLVILDGSIIPSALGINPALTIAAVAERSMDLLLEKDRRWLSYELPNNETPKALTKVIERPTFTRNKNDETTSIPTKVTITERLNGKARILDDTGAMRDVMMELTLLTQSHPLKNLRQQVASKHERLNTLKINDSAKEYEDSLFPASKLRIYYLKDWKKIRKSSKYADMSDDYLNSIAQYVAPVTGDIEILRYENTFFVSRTARAAWAWWRNRGKRDVYQATTPKSGKARNFGLYARSLFSAKSISKFSNYVASLFALLSKAGELRKFEYKLNIKRLDENAKRNRDFTYFDHEVITGIKEFTYTRRANPWRQLSEIKLIGLPRRDKRSEPIPVLRLDAQYLASKRIPLIQITNQENQVKAIMDLFSFSMYMTRLVLRVHFLSFRNPEPPLEHRINHRPAPLKDTAFPLEHRLLVGSIPDNRVPKLRKGDDVYAHVTEYRHPSPRKAPVLMIHGYSASGSTFSHDSLPNSLAQFFYNDERAVWIADLRTSPVHRHSTYPWTFEQVANSDIPKIVEYIFERSNKQKIDTIAHCMGSAMLSMALLNSRKITEEPDFYKDRLNRIVFSQAAPALTLTPENTFRSFLSYHLKELIPSSYQFKPTNESDLATQLLDRLLYTLPYPTSDYDSLNPWKDKKKRIHHAQTRHRMDAFYGRTFELENMSEESLGKINDFFGPMHIETMNQVSQFARKRVLTNYQGQNVYLSKHLLKKNWPFPTFSIHSINNGLVDFSTGERTKKIFSKAGIRYETVLIEDKKYGHQDSILGPEAHKDIFPHMARFLSTNFNSKIKPNNNSLKYLSTSSKSGFQRDSLLIEPPQMGPILLKPDSSHDDFIIALGTDDSLATKPIIVVIPVTKKQDRFFLVGETTEQRRKKIAQCVAYSMSKSHRPIPYFTSSNQDNKRQDGWTTRHFSRTEFDEVSRQGSFLILLIYPNALAIGRRAVPQNLSPIGPRYSKRSINEIHEDRRQVMDSLRSDHNALENLDTKIDERLYEELESELIDQLELFFSSKRAQQKQYLRGLMSYKEPKKKDENTLSFAFGSCQYPANPFDRQIAYAAYEKFTSKVINGNGSQKIDFLALIGDQVYIDATAGFLDPLYTHEKFEQPYINWLSNHHVSEVFRNTPIYNMLDDHEIVNNWEPKSNQVDSWNTDDEFRNGVKAFLKYQRGVIIDDTKIKPSLWYHFIEKGFDFFMTDTRTERCYRDAKNINEVSTRIMSDEQFQALSEWLKEAQERAPNKPKFVMSSCALLPSQILEHSSPNGNSAIRADGWDGYPASLHRLLSLVVDEGIDNVVFLCGDIHLNVDAHIDLVNKTNLASVSARIITCSGLYAPLPFANRDLNAVQDIQIYPFEYSQSESDQAKCQYECTVAVTNKSNENGFAIISAEPDTAEVKLEFTS